MPQRILFVCLGNICRSPLAEGIFRAQAGSAGLAGALSIDSAGTGPWHVGKPPDPRSIQVAAQHGIDISTQRARQIAATDFGDFDTILAMDRNNLATLEALDSGTGADLRLLLDTPAQDVPDPYYGGPGGFEDVYQLLWSGCENFLNTLRRD